jgi:hypothetical protein
MLVMRRVRETELNLQSARKEGMAVGRIANGSGDNRNAQECQGF